VTLYRVDKRDFGVGDVVTTAGEFTSKNPEGSIIVEELFELSRPEGKPVRHECLFLFENLEVAKKHWSKMKDGKLYKVEIDDEEILHKGDMEYVDKAFIVESNSDKNDCARDYWAGIKTDNPRIEILVSSAIVTEIISNNDHERKEYLISWIRAC
jgi:hypothetical protein